MTIYKQGDIVLANWKSAGLLKPSAIKPILSSFETNLVRRKLGKLSSADLKALRAMFARVFELE